LYHNETLVGRLQMDVNESSLVDLYTDFATTFISRHQASGSNPWFMYFALDATHEPVYFPDRFANSTPRGPFGDAVAASDDAVGRLLSALEDAGMTEDTLVVYTGDNGAWNSIPPEQAGTTGQFQASWASAQFTGAAATDTGKGSTWEGGYRLPGIFRWPGTIAPGQVEFEVVSTLDYLPTFAALAGAELPEVILDGRDISPMFTQSQADRVAWGSGRGERGLEPQKAFFYYRGPVLLAARGSGNTSAFKAHFATHSGFGNESLVWHDPPVVFNLETDAGEREPLDAESPTTVAIVRDLTAIVAQHNATMIRGEPQLDKTAFTALNCAGLTKEQSGCCLEQGGKCKL
jgi:arylsulfatase A-like enzyme